VITRQQVESARKALEAFELEYLKEHGWVYKTVREFTRDWDLAFLPCWTHRRWPGEAFDSRHAVEHQMSHEPNGLPRCLPDPMKHRGPPVFHVAVYPEMHLSRLLAGPQEPPTLDEVRVATRAFRLEYGALPVFWWVEEK
jgi:hypothetical protein